MMWKAKGRNAFSTIVRALIPLDVTYGMFIILRIDIALPIGKSHSAHWFI
jgi:hypothetical protein